MVIVPSYALKELKSAFDEPEKLVMTYSAKRGQISLGLDEQDVVNVRQNLTKRDFYKTMPPFRVGFTEWQDVYKTRYNNLEIYIKFQKAQNGQMIVSLKEK